jgi:hypothetical protein
MNKRLPWFRMYTDFLNDPKLISLAFEDQRHFIGVLALKCDGAIDDVADGDLLDRIVAQRLWIDHAVIRDVKRRLIAAGLIDARWQPLAWDKRQARSDVDATGAERQRRYREAQKHNALRDGAVTRLEEELDIDKEEEKEEKKATRKRAAPTFELPDWINKTHWDAWHSCSKRKNASDAQKQMAVDKLDSWRQQGIDHAAALENAAIAGWQGLFKPDVPAAAMTPGRRSNAQPHKYAAAAAAIFDFDDNPAPSGPSEVIDV